jgi:hypothetical protein
VRNLFRNLQGGSKSTRPVWRWRDPLGICDLLTPPGIDRRNQDETLSVGALKLTHHHRHRCDDAANGKRQTARAVTLRVPDMVETRLLDRVAFAWIGELGLGPA